MAEQASDDTDYETFTIHFQLPKHAMIVIGDSKVQPPPRRHSNPGHGKIPRVINFELPGEGHGGQTLEDYAYKKVCLDSIQIIYDIVFLSEKKIIDVDPYC